MTNEFIALLANISLALSFVAALLFGIVQVRAAARDRRERLTLEALRTFQTREFSELIIFINRRNMPVNRKGMLALPLNEQVMLIQFGQKMESLGLLVAEHLINIDLVDKILGDYVIMTWEKFRPMVEDKDNAA